MQCVVGVKGIFTAHGNCFEEIFLNDKMAELIEKFIIEKIIFLDDKNKGEIKEVYKLDKKNKKYILE